MEILAKYRENTTSITSIGFKETFVAPLVWRNFAFKKTLTDKQQITTQSSIKNIFYSGTNHQKTR